MDVHDERQRCVTVKNTPVEGECIGESLCVKHLKNHRGHRCGHHPPIWHDRVATRGHSHKTSMMGAFPPSECPCAARSVLQAHGVHQFWRGSHQHLCRVQLTPEQLDAKEGCALKLGCETVRNGRELCEPRLCQGGVGMCSRS